MPSPQKQTKSSRPFLSFLRTSSSTKLPGECTRKDLPSIPGPDPPPFTAHSPPLPPPQIPLPACPGSERSQTKTRTRWVKFDDEVTDDRAPRRVGDESIEPPQGQETTDASMHSSRYGSPISVRQQTATPDNLFPPLRFGSPTNTPGTRPSHSRTTSNTPSRLRSATLQSPDSGAFTTPPNRLRSATIESSTTIVSSTNTFGTHTPPKVIARDYASPSTTTPNRLPALQVTCPTISPQGGHRRRPSKLTLRTTNLTPTVERDGEMTPTPTNFNSAKSEYMTPLDSRTEMYPGSAITRRAKNAREREKRRSRSTGDLESLVIRPSQHRVSRSESSRLEMFPTEVDPSSDTESRRGTEVYTPASILSTSTSLSTLSDATISPDKSMSTGSGTRFENVPLPWSTLPLETLEPALPANYLPLALEEISSRSPYILSPSTLASLSSEEARLQLELERLKVKHTTLSQRRDKLLIRVNGSKGGVGAIQEIMARVDRVARQIFICNDQIRQMEVMKRDHEIGVLLWALSRGQRTCPEEQACLTRKNEGGGEQRAKAEEVVGLDEPLESVLPHIQLTRATVYEPETQEDDGYEMLNSSELEYFDKAADNRLSTISLPLSPIKFSFPIPPSRTPFPFWQNLPSNEETKTEVDHQESESDGHGHEFDDAESDLDHDYDHDYTSSFRHEPDQQAVNYRSLLHPSDPGLIVIYPPGHERDQQIPLSPGIDMPHTPNLGSTDSHSHYERTKIPLRTRRSRPDLTIPIPARPTSKRFLLGRDDKDGTSPLRLRLKGNVKKTQSMPYHARTISGHEEFKRGRESRLECPESIMLSLATAELWTKGLHGRG